MGGHKDLLPYLVRRLLENGANTSFVNRIVDDEISVDQIVADPIIALRDAEPKPHPHIPLPRFLYGGERLNSQGINLHDVATLRPLAQSMDRFASHQWCAAPIVGGEVCGGDSSPVFNPANRDDCIGNVTNADDTLVDQALTLAANAYWQWDRTPAEDRAGCLERMADLLEQHMPELMAMCTREGGKTLADGVAEVREAADFCRYYAMLARKTFAQPMPLQGATGERNQLELHGRGVFACISPWNFPLAIFTGQVAAALAAGNAVIAKPAKQTPMIAMRAVELFHQAGVPAQVLHFLPGSGSVLGPKLACDPRVAGIAFTGSTETAQSINQLLAARRGAIVPFIAETGGQNAMIVDSSALPDQVISDVLRSAYTSAGQRCSALRVLFVQQDVADRIVELLAGAMEQLRVGNPAWLHTDVGPVIDEAARKGLAAHAERMASTGRLLAEAPLSAEAARGTFFAPHAFELTDLNMLQREVFGPVLHVVRFPTRGLDRVIQAVNQTGYGLTLGIHSRIDATAEYIQQRVRVGNTYVNRNIIGSVVGVQPFGGEGLSGTGPKAGGPHYLFRFATERTVTINTAAMGGNTTLLSLRD